MNRLDIVHFIVTETLARNMPGEPRQRIEELAKPMLQPIHELLGGDRYYIPEHSPALKQDRRAAIIKDAIAPGPIQAVESRHGVHRSTVYRLFKRPDRG